MSRDLCADCRKYRVCPFRDGDFQCQDHDPKAPVAIVASPALKPVFESVAALQEAAKSGPEAFPTTDVEALAWVRSAPDRESRNARKTLTHAMIYGANPETFAKILNRRQQ